MLGITTLHNGMILSTLSISSHDFAFVSPKGLIPNGEVFLTYKPMIISLIRRCGTPHQPSSTHLLFYPIETYIFSLAETLLDVLISFFFSFSVANRRSFQCPLLNISYCPSSEVDLSDGKDLVREMLS